MQRDRVKWKRKGEKGKGKGKGGREKGRKGEGEGRERTRRTSHERAARCRVRFPSRKARFSAGFLPYLALEEADALRRQQLVGALRLVLVQHPNAVESSHDCDGIEGFEKIEEKTCERKVR